MKTSSKPNDTTTSTSTTTKNNNTDKAIPIKGRNVSGRSWKKSKQQRASQLLATSHKNTNLSTSWEQKVAAKRQRQELLQLQQSINEEKRLTILEKKERKLQQEQRRQENAFQQAEKFAKQLNTGKIHSTLKAMSTKQLRQIKKQRVNPKTGVREYVPAYAK